MLQTCSLYWPDSGMAGFGPFTVEALHKEDEVDVFSRVFRLQNTAKVLCDVQFSSMAMIPYFCAKCT